MHKLLSEYDIALGKRIRDYRVTHNFSQKELVDYVDLKTVQALSRIESGKRRMTTEELEKTALFFNIPMQMLIRPDYKYTYPTETPYGVVPTFIAKFMEDVRYSHKNFGDIYDKEGKKYYKILSSALKLIPIEVKKEKQHEELKNKKNESNNLSKSINN